MLMASTATLLGQVCRTISRSNSETVSDTTLLSQFVQAGNETAFEELLRRHGPLVWGVCRRMLNHHTDAEDAFQSVWIVLSRKARSIHQPERLVQWLYGVARHAALNVRKMKKRRERREQPWRESIDVTDPIQQVWSDLRPVVDDELSRLPAKYQLPLMLCCLQGKSHHDAAEQLAWPIGTVAGRLSRGREMLRQRLLKRGIQVSPAILATVLSQEVMAGVLPPTLLLSTIKAVFTSTTVGLAGTALSPTISTIMHSTLQDMFVKKFLTLGVYLFGLVAACFSVGFCWYWGFSNHVSQEITAAGVPSIIQSRIVTLPADPQAVIMRWKYIDTQQELPDTELTLRANGELTGSRLYTPLDLMVTTTAQLSKREVQEIMQFAVHDQQVFSVDTQGVWSHLRKQYEFNGDQRAPDDTMLTEMEIQTADKSHHFAWYQLASSEAWFHEVPAVRHMAALQRRMRNMMLVIEAGGSHEVDRIAQQLNASLRKTYPQMNPFDSTHLAKVALSRENDARQWTFTHGSKFGNPRYFSATCEESPTGLRLVTVTPGPASKVPTMKRRVAG